MPSGLGSQPLARRRAANVRLPHSSHATLLGPAETPIATIKDRHRWHNATESDFESGLTSMVKDTLTETHQERDQATAARISGGY